MDFTLKSYQNLIQTLQREGYSFFTFEDYCSGRAEGKFVILRHDVDLKVDQSVKVAALEATNQIRASYYFRVCPQSNQPDKIKQIAGMGHEIGYHYEDMSLCKGDIVEAYNHFCKKLDYFRSFYPVKTICMHGSPTSRYDNRHLWKCYDYKELDILGEPYFDVDFEKVFYLTDTGRCWDGEKFSVRDKVCSHFKQSYHSTDNIIQAACDASLPHQIMITTHPQRWTSNPVEWVTELVMQNLKNVVKRLIS